MTIDDNSVKVIEKNSRTILFSCTISEIDKAYSFAEQMEGNGVEIELLSPSCPESLARALGASYENLQAEIDAEISSHLDDFGCGICLVSTDKLTIL